MEKKHVYLNDYTTITHWNQKTSKANNDTADHAK